MAGRPARPGLSFAARLTLVLAVLLLAYAALVAVLSRQVARVHEQEALQRLSYGLAAHIIGHWPEITSPQPDPADLAARDALLKMLMVVNPGIQVYTLGASGQVQAYIGPPGMVRQHQVDLGPVQAFLAGAALPLQGTDPMGGPDQRLFSVAMFPPLTGQAAPPGYLYIVLDGGTRAQVAGAISQRRVWLGAAAVGAVGLLVTWLLGALTFRHLTRPLHRLATRLQAYSLQHSGPANMAAAGVAADVVAGTAATAGAATTPSSGDEISALASAFDGMTRRIDAQAALAMQQAQDHREMMASVAHDLRTPLTALHGHLEALASSQPTPTSSQPAPTSSQPAPTSAQAGTTPAQHRLLPAALAQSNKVRRLSQQLFELAALQSDHQVLHRERFNLDELVTDAVQKFELSPQQPPVQLAGAPPGPLALDGDLQLIERALTNLIDNAQRHAPGSAPVQVSLRRSGSTAQILVEDSGPGLPPELLRRLGAQASLRDPPLPRPSGHAGGIGGLGLAIAQRVALLHGGSLLPLPAPLGGTRLCLVLPLAA